MRKTLLLATLLIVAFGLIFAQADQSVVNKGVNKLTKASTTNNNQAASQEEKQVELDSELTQAQKIEAEEAALAVREAARQAEIAAEAAKLAAEKQKEATELAKMAAEQEKLKSEQAKLETPVVEVEKKIDPELIKLQHEQELAEQDKIRHEEYERNKLLAQERAILDKTAGSEANKTVQAVEEAKVLSDEEVEAAWLAEKENMWQLEQEKLAIEAEAMKNQGDLPVIWDTQDYCPSTYTYMTDDWITNVNFNGINNATGQDGADSYGDYTSISTNASTPGTAYTLSVTFTSGTYTEYVRAWIDWDQDEVFATTESYYLGSGVSTTLTLNITVPLTATLGTTRMRVIEKYASDPGADGACNGQGNHGTSWGETEDYSVLVGDYVPVYGACCDETIPQCTDGVEQMLCPAPMRFVANTLCADLDPPCGEFEGACCYLDGSCEVLSPADCATAGGTYQGNWTDCDPNPCPQPIWDCTDWPPTDKEAGGDKDTDFEPLNDSCHTTEAEVACEFAYCGSLDAAYPDYNDRADWYMITIPGDGWYGLHIRVFADDTPGTYAFGGGLDPNVGVYDIDCTTRYLYNGDYNGTYPDAEHWDSQIDPEADGNCFAPGTNLYIKVAAYNAGPYLLVINCVPCDIPIGACCVDEACVATNSLDECDLLSGDWHQGEICHVDPDSSFFCPPEVDWDCNLNPPPGKTGGGNLDVEPNDTTTTAIPVQVEYAYCGALDPPGGDTDDYYVVTLPAGPSEYYCLHVRVFADDTPYQYAYGDSLDPWLYIYADDGTTQLYSDDDYNGTFPDAVHYDSQYDCNDESNCFQAGSTLYIRIYASSTRKAGPYLLIINAYECETPTGACCVDEVCVATNTLSECDAMSGIWYQGEICHPNPDSSFYCPPEVDWDCNLNPPPGKTGGGDIDIPSEPLNNLYTGAAIAQVEYAYCGDLRVDPADTADWYMVTLPDDGFWHCMHVRVFADDTPYQFAEGLGLDPTLKIYADDGTSLLFSSYGYYGTFPEAEGGDCQIDCSEANCFPPGTVLYIKIDCSSTYSGPYLLIINESECDEPTGACCVDEVCVATNYLGECDLLDGVWHQDEICHTDPDSSFYCPPEIDWDCDLNPPPGKTDGGDIDTPSEPANNQFATAAIAQVEYAYCGAIAVADTDYYAVTLPAVEDYYCLHVRVFADDTPYQYANGDSLDPKLYIYDSDGITQLYYNDDQYGTFPDAERQDSQYDCDDAGNCFSAGKLLYVRVIGYNTTTSHGPYLLIINAYSCTPPAGRCCDYTDPAVPVCTDDVFEPDCQGDFETWSSGLNCTDNPCPTLPTGRCCDYTDPLVPVCTDAVYEQNCQGEVMVWTSGLNCIDDPCPVPNPGDNCLAPIELVRADLPYSNTGETTCDRGNDYSNTCLGSYDADQDIIYSFTNDGAETVYLTADMTNSSNDYIGMLIDDTCPPGGTDECVDYTTGGLGVYELHLVGIPVGIGETVYIMVDSWIESGCPTGYGIPSFDMAINVSTTPPVGRCCYGDPMDPDCADNTEAECTALSGAWTYGLNCTDDPCPILLPGENCDVAIVAVLDEFNEYSDTRNSCDYVNDYEYVGPDVVYTFTLAEAAHLQFQTCNSEDDFWAIIWLYDEFNCGGTQLAYMAYDGCPTGNHARLDYECDPGTYYLIVDGSATTPNCGNYLLEISEYVVPTGRCCYYDEAPADLMNPICAAPVTEGACDTLIGTFSGVWTEGIMDCITDPCPVPGDFDGVETFDAMLTKFTNYTAGGISAWQWSGTIGNPAGCAWHNDISGVTSDDYLISNGSYTVPDVDNIHLIFDQDCTYSFAYETGNHTVLISTNFTGNPSTATWIELYEGFGGTDWVTEYLSLEAYRGQAVNIAFRYIGTYDTEWYVDNINVTTYVPPTGRCCYDDPRDPLCANGLSEAECYADPYFGHDWLEAGTCETDVCEPTLIECPYNSLFGQSPTGPDESWTFATSEMDVGNGTGYLVYENFTGVTEDICDIHFWGAPLYHDGVSWSACTENPMDFEITFYPDNGGIPDTANPSCVYNLTITGTPLPDLYGSTYIAYEYSAILTPCCSITDGWVSIGGTTDPSCWFMWLSSGEPGPGLSYQHYLDAGDSLTLSDYDLSLCLTPAEPIGACCVGIECAATNTEPECTALSGTWFEGETCPEYSCAPTGACCVDEVCVATNTEAQCTALLGTWHADETCPEFDCSGPSCYEYLPGDVNMSGGSWPAAATGPDVTYLVNFFRGIPTSVPCKKYNPLATVPCFWASADANGSCDIIGSDVTKLVNVFRGIGSIQYCPDYVPCWLTPADLPPSRPDGWPNCEDPCPPTTVTGKGVSETPDTSGK